MKVFKVSVATLLLQLCVFSLYAQVEIPVNMYTGTPSITVPIWTVVSQDISVPIELSYNANAARQYSRYGSGWTMVAGGSITRDLRSLPDDYNYTATSPAKRGWLFKDGTAGNGAAATGSNAADIGSWNPAADFSTSWNSGEGLDHIKISGFQYMVDTEPDIFNYSVNGISGSFVFGNDLQIHMIPHREDIKIEMNQNASTKLIDGFTITTNTGYVYKFDKKLTAAKQTRQGDSWVDGNTWINGSTFCVTEAEMFKTIVSYTGEWKLSEIVSPSGANVAFIYTVTTDDAAGTQQFGVYEYPDPFYAPNLRTDNRTMATFKGTSSSFQTGAITSITASSGAKVEFISNTKIKISDDRRGSTDTEKFVKSFEFGYLTVYEKEGLNTNDIPRRINFLSSVTETSGCDRMPAYKFSYRNLYHIMEGQYNSVNIEGDYIFNSGLGIDLWGFPNVAPNAHLFPKLYIYPDEKAVDRYRTTKIPDHTGREYILPGANRQPDIAGMLPGTLQSITSPEGGVTTFTFEGNSYFDARTNSSSAAGGLRIKSIEYFDGINIVPVKKTFDYEQGYLLRKPAIAMPVHTWRSKLTEALDLTFESPENGAPDRNWLLTDERKWQFLTARSTGDLSAGERTQGGIVGYKFVTVKRAGAGSARYEYSVPGVYGDSVSGEWLATRIRVARAAASSYQSLGVITENGDTQWAFPFVPNPDIDYERGLPVKKTEYDETGKIVRETTTEYQSVYKTGVTVATTTSKVWGLKYDRYLGTANDNKVFFYGKYFLITDVQKVPKKETVKTFDATGIDYVTESTQYIYGSTAHKLLTTIKRTTSEGNVYSTNIKYPLDYTTVTSGNSDAVAIGTLKTLNRNGITVEQIEVLKKAGDNTKRVIGGSVIKLDQMGMGFPTVRSTWALKTNPPIDSASFYNSTVVTSGGKFKIDSRYEKTDSIISYTSFGSVKESWSPISRKFSSVGYGYNSSIPVVQIANAKTSGVVFSDFETTTGLEFSSSASYFGPGHTGAKGFHPSVALKSKGLGKDVLAPRYILTLWLKSDQARVFNILIKTVDIHGAGDVTVYSDTISRSSTGSVYKFVQKIIPASSFPSSFVIELQATSLSTPAGMTSGGYDANLTTLIDDVYFYPETADMAASTYTIPFGASAVTTASGSTGYTEFDKLGRSRFVYDKNKDIVKRNVYLYTTTSPLPSDFSIPEPSKCVNGVPIEFTAPTNDCVTDATYEWNWGSGFESGSSMASRTFANVGTYNVSLRVTSSTYGTKTITKSILVSPSTYEYDICARGIVFFIDNGVPDVIATCDYITSAPKKTNGIIFKVPGVNATNLSFQWQRRDLGSEAWVNVGGNYDQYDAAPPTVSYEVRCQINFSIYKIGISRPVQVIYAP